MAGAYMHSRRGLGGVTVAAPSRPSCARKCSLGCPVLDSLLQGGIPCGSITELVGECGSAKTQLCLQLLLSAQIPPSQGGLGASSVYVFTESYFPSRRLQQLAKGFVDAGKFRLGLGPLDQNNSSPRRSAAELNYSKLNPSLGLSPYPNPIPNSNLRSKLEIDEFESSVDMQNERRNAVALNHNPDPRLCFDTDDNTCFHPGSKLCRFGELSNWQVDDGISYCDEGNYNLQNGERSYAPGKPNPNPSRKLCSDAELSNWQVDDGISGKLESSTDPCDNIFVQAIQTVEELCAFLDQVHLLLSRPLAMPVKLLVIDSMAALFRSDFDNNARDLAKRIEWFFKISSKLKQYAHQFGIAVLVTSQVVDHVEQESLERQDSLDVMLCGSSGPLISAGRRVVPALGIGWSHCVNTRLFLSRAYELDKQVRSCHPHTGPPKFIPCGGEGEGEPHYVKLNHGRVSEPHSSILQHLELELPDDLLLTLSHQKSTSCHGHDHNPNPLSCHEVAAANEEETSQSIIERPLSSHDWSMDSESHPAIRVRRTLQVVFAPHLPASSCEFVVETTKVRGVLALPLHSVFSCDEKT